VAKRLFDEMLCAHRPIWNQMRGNKTATQQSA
jgi:hypothetical protein